MILTDKLFRKFSALVYEECGINLHEGKKALLQARLNKCLRATNIESYEAYYKHLTSDSNSDELVHFLDSISTNHTYFFREPQHFDLLNQLLSEMLDAKRKDRSNRIRIWSAGCSTGEEPYSLSMCVLSHLEDVQKYDFRILSTDISTRALTVAARGVYSEDKVLKVNSDLRRTYFRKISNGDSPREFEVVPLLKKIVTFRRLNLKDPFPFKGPFDFIFCRNVMIYFDKTTQESLVEKMAGYLAPGGYLFVGHSESLMGLSHSLTYVYPAVYRK
ncbi:MAG: CheR family methyltransferase [Syntrophobacteraceae bacterium]